MFRTTNNTICVVALCTLLIVTVIGCNGSKELASPADRSMDLIESGDFQAAINLLDRELKSGDDAELIQLRGIANMELENVSAAIADFTKAAELDPDELSTRVNLGAARIANGEFQLAIDELSTVLKIDGEDADAFRNRALAYSKLGKFELAISDYAYAMSLFEGIDPALFEERALCWSGLNNEPQAEIDREIARTTIALDNNPDDGEAYLQRGLSLYELGEYELSLVDLDDAIELGQSTVAAFLARGNCLFILEDPENALVDLNQSILLNSNSAAAYASRANVYEELGEFRSAIKDYEEALNMESGDPMIQSELAWLLATCSDPSIRDAKRAIELAQAAVESTNSESWHEIAAYAAALAANGDFKQARQHQQKAIDLAPLSEETDTEGETNALLDAMKQYEQGQVFISKL